MVEVAEGGSAMTGGKGDDDDDDDNDDGCKEGNPRLLILLENVAVGDAAECIETCERLESVLPSFNSRNPLPVVPTLLRTLP